MSFRVQPFNGDDEGDKWELVFSDEPSYIHALKMASEVREPELDVGIWLVVAFSVWSVPVRHSVAAAIACAKDNDGKFQLGVRPFRSYEEIYKWWPSGDAPSADKVLMAVRDEPQCLEIHISTDPSSGLAWIVLRDGQVIHQGTGPRSKEQLIQLMQTALG